MDFWAIWPDRIDLRDAWRRMMRFAGKHEAPPDKFAKYPLENKLYHGAIIAAGLSAIVTGVFMMFRVRTIFFPRNPYLFGDMNMGHDVRAARPGGRRIDRIDHGPRLLRTASGEAPNHEIDDLRLDEPRFLFERA